METLQKRKPNVKYASGQCPQCGAVVTRKRPADLGICNVCGCEVPLYPTDSPEDILSKRVTIRLPHSLLTQIENLVLKRKRQLMYFAEQRLGRDLLNLDNNEDFLRWFWAENNRLTVSGLIREALQIWVGHLE
jgi:hypothetical protein